MGVVGGVGFSVLRGFRVLFDLKAIERMECSIIVAAMTVDLFNPVSLSTRESQSRTSFGAFLILIFMILCSDSHIAFC